MLEISSKSLSKFFHFILFTFITLAALFAYQIRNGNQFDVDKYVATVERSSALDDLRVRIKEVEDSIHVYRVRSTFQKIKDVTKRVTDISGTQNLEKSKFVDIQAMQNFEKTYDELVSLPALNEIVRVFNTRVKKYYEFVLTNRWPTLTRIASSIQDKLEIVIQKNKGQYNYSLISNSLKNLRYDISRLETITSRSRLEDGRKQVILNRTLPMKLELDKIIKYVNLFNRFEVNTKRYFRSINIWAAELAPVLEREKIAFHSEADNHFVFLMSFIGMCLVFMFLGRIIFKREEKKNLNQTRESILSIIKSEVLELGPVHQKSLLEGRFKQEVDLLKDYCQKRMKLGKVLNVTSPFPMFVLDHDLNITWANNHFKNLFSLNENFEITWDYFRKNTNLGESDPINSAITKDIAGIYQIQLKTIQDEKPVPFEIYVSPTNEYDEKRIVVWFYPLQSLQDTLVDQTKSIVGPVSRMLDSLVSDSYTKEFEKDISNDFAIAGINDLFDKFKSFNTKNDILRIQLLNYVDKLEEEIFDLKKGLTQLGGQLVEVDGKNREISQFLSKVKQSFVKILGHNEKIEEIERRIFSSSEQQTQIMKNAHGDLSNFYEFVQSVQKVGRSVEEIRELQKENIEYVSALRLWMKKATRQAKGIEENGEISEGITQNVAMIESAILKSQKNCDVLISKLDILFKALPVNTLKQSSKAYDGHTDDIKMKNMDFHAINTSIFDTADKSVENFKQTFSLLNSVTRLNIKAIGRSEKIIQLHEQNHIKLKEQRLPSLDA